MLDDNPHARDPKVMAQLITLFLQQVFHLPRRSVDNRIGTICHSHGGTNLVAGPGFEPGMLRAYETGVVTTLPAIIKRGTMFQFKRIIAMQYAIGNIQKTAHKS